MMYCLCCGGQLAAAPGQEEADASADCHGMVAGGERSSLAQVPVPKTFPSWVSVTNTIVLLNFAVFVAMGFPIHGLNVERLVMWGASWGPLSLDRQWWRMFTFMFVHGELGHLLVNMCCLWVMGRMAERIFGKWAFLLLYILSGLAGGILTLGLRPEVVASGASAAIFGVMGVLLATLSLGRLPESAAKLKRRFWPLLIFVAYSLYSTATDSSVDHAAHVGGLLAGLAMGILLSRSETEPLAPRTRLRRLVFVGVAVLLVAATIFVRHQNGYVVLRRFAAEAMEAGRFDEAARNATIVLKRRPNDALTNYLMGEIYFRRLDYTRAESSLKRALASDPEYTRAEYLLGLVYLRTERFDDVVGIATKLSQSRHGHPTMEEEGALFGAALDGKGQHADAGDYYLGHKLYDKAIDSFWLGLRQNLGDQRCRLGLVRAYRANGRNKEADEFEKTIKLYDHDMTRPHGGPIK
jgi:membrane associated rhomboid family serine protease